MSRIRVLVVDDSVAMRRIVSNLIGSDPAIEVVGSASSGRLALAKIDQLRPDVMTLDVEMPEMDGLQTLAALRSRGSKLPVIMLSTLTQRGAAATLDALALGASCYVTKPSNTNLHATAQVRDELLGKIKALCAPSVASAPGATSAAARPTHAVLLPPDIVAIGSSTGGPNALAAVLGQLPATVPVPIVIVQHMPPLFTALLADRLHQTSRLTVREAVQGAELRPGTVWLARGGMHMAVERHAGIAQLRLNEDREENFCRPAVDVLFRSVAAAYGARALAVVLTGMGSDGALGCAAIRSSGGQIFAQDEASSVVWGMPGHVVHGGLADRVLPLEQVAAAMLHALQAPAVTAARGRALSSKWMG